MCECVCAWCVGTIGDSDQVAKGHGHQRHKHVLHWGLEVKIIIITFFVLDVGEGLV